MIEKIDFKFFYSDAEVEKSRPVRTMECLSAKINEIIDAVKMLPEQKEFESYTEFKQAFKIFCDTLKKDKGLHIGYQSSIAMSFFDACKNAGYNFPELHKLANEAADNFLKMLLKEPEEIQKVTVFDEIDKNGNIAFKEIPVDINPPPIPTPIQPSKEFLNLQEKAQKEIDKIVGDPILMPRLQVNRPDNAFQLNNICDYCQYSVGYSPSKCGPCLTKDNFLGKKVMFE